LIGLQSATALIAARLAKTWLDYIHRSPAHLRAYPDGLIPSTQRQEFDALTHSFVLEPDSITSRYLRVPKLDRRTKAGKERYAELSVEASARGLTMVDSETWQRATVIKDAVYRHKAAAAMLRQGEVEQAVLWTNPETGELCKGRAAVRLDRGRNRAPVCSSECS
jgi:hypothetical protein